MKAVVLSAGEGYRCRPLTLTRSKVMLPVANKPILEHIITALKENGIKDIVLVVGYKKERVMDYFEDGIAFDVNISYVEQRSQLGTAHAIKLTKPLLDEDFLVLNGDNLIDRHTIADLINNKKPDASILVARRDHIEEYGVVCHKNNKLTSIMEKPREVISHLVNTGIYYFTPVIFEEINKTPISEYGEYAITETLQLMVEAGYDVHVVETEHMWIDAVHSWNLLDANSTLLSECQKMENKGTVEQGAFVGENVAIGEGSIIRSGAYILGPTIIGSNCVIGPNTIILPATAIGDNTHIEGLVKIHNSIIMDNVDIGSHSLISDSIIGSDNTIKSHFVTEVGENLKIEVREAIHRVAQLGCVMGDDNRIGNRVTVLSGCMIETRCTIYSNVVINRNIPAGSLVI
jgi:glucose-1-phosphate thymidylyltransferase